MKKNGKKVLWTGGLALLAFVVWTALLQLVDVQLIGQQGTSIGFASLNGWFHQLTGVHMTLYTITDWLGLVPVFVCLLFGSIGLVQLITRKSLRQVDYDILALGVYYGIVIVGYLVFEMFPINYRPILIEGRLEASYPSSTTLLVLSVMPTWVEQMYRRLHSTLGKRLVALFTMCFSAFMVLARLLSGVHWLTDIVGGILLSIGLFCIYRAVVLLYGEKEQQ